MPECYCFRSARCNSIFFIFGWYKIIINCQNVNYQKKWSEMNETGMASQLPRIATLYSYILSLSIKLAGPIE